MTLLTTVFAAIICTIIWYTRDSQNTMKTGTLSLMFWGASLMWFVDAIYEYAELKAAYFMQAPMDMLNDLFLGLSVIALALIIWTVLVIVKDPKNVIRAKLAGK